MQHDFRRIWLYYVVRNDEAAVYDAEIRESYLEAESYIDYTLGAGIAPLEGYAVMLWGQAGFIEDLARQFQAVGVPRNRIFTEEFEFR